MSEQSTERQPLERQPPERHSVDRQVSREMQMGSVAPINSGSNASEEGIWTRRLVLYLRVMAALALFKGLYHWGEVTGFIGTEDTAFLVQPTSWQAATIYFAVIELVAAIGLWLATPWGAVVWLTSVVSMGVIELMFPNIYGGNFLIVIVDVVLLGIYLGLAWMAALERPP